MMSMRERIGGYRLVTAPTAQPLTLAEIKADLRIDHNNDDATLQRTMVEAQEWLERRLQLRLMTQTWQLTVDTFPAAEMNLPFGPVQSVTSVKYDDPDGAEQTLAADQYILDQASYRVLPQPWLIPVGTWPSTSGKINSVRIEFVAGYQDAAHVPPSIVSAFRLKVRGLFDGEDTEAEIDCALENYDLVTA